MQVNPSLHKSETKKIIKIGANWFYWIAGLSFINSIFLHSGGNMSFFFGLKITQLIDALGIIFYQAYSTGAEEATSNIQTEEGFAEAVRQTPLFVKGIIIGINLVAASLFVIIGIFANKYKKWAFLTGLILFSVDSLLSLLSGDFFSMVLCLVPLWGIFAGYKALLKFEKLNKEETDTLPREVKYEIVQ